jgi:hypothetical protein
MAWHERATNAYIILSYMLQAYLESNRWRVNAFDRLLGEHRYGVCPFPHASSKVIDCRFTYTLDPRFCRHMTSMRLSETDTFQL